MKATVKAVLKKGNTPHNFPWVNGVSVNVLLDQRDTRVDAFINGLKGIKAMVNKDANKFGFKLSDFDVTIDL